MINYYCFYLNNVYNYRGITLISTLGKLFTHVLNNRLMFWADSHTILLDAQADPPQ